LSPRLHFGTELTARIVILPGGIGRIFHGDPGVKSNPSYSLYRTEPKYGEKLKTNRYSSEETVRVMESVLMPMRDAQETCTRNWYQKTGNGFCWYVWHAILHRFFWYQILVSDRTCSIRCQFLVQVSWASVTGIKEKEILWWEGFVKQVYTF